MMRRVAVSAMLTVGGLAFAPSEAKADSFSIRIGGYSPYVGYSSCYSSPVRYVSYPYATTYGGCYGGYYGGYYGNSGWGCNSNYYYSEPYYPSYSGAVVYSRPVVRYARPVSYSHGYSNGHHRPYVSHYSSGASRNYASHYRPAHSSHYSTGSGRGHGYSNRAPARRGGYQSYGSGPSRSHSSYRGQGGRSRR